LSAFVRPVVLLGLVLLTVVLAASPAHAHAALLETTPANRVVVQDPPREVVLRYSEPVATSLEAVKVLDPNGERVDVGRVITAAGGAEVVVPLRPDLGHGTYLISWRVVSQDSHPVSGASTFSVGHPSPSAAPGEAASTGAAGQLLALSLDPPTVEVGAGCRDRESAL
jgi:copper transport protein